MSFRKVFSTVGAAVGVLGQSSSANDDPSTKKSFAADTCEAVCIGATTGMVGFGIGTLFDGTAKVMARNPRTALAAMTVTSALGLVASLSK